MGLRPGKRSAEARSPLARRNEIAPGLAIGKGLGESRGGEQFPDFRIRHEDHEKIDRQEAGNPRDRGLAPGRFEQIDQ